MTTKNSHDALKKPQPVNNGKAVCRITGICISIAVLLTDQLSKWHVTENIISKHLPDINSLDFIGWYINKPDMLPYTQIRITDFFNIVMAWNTGVSFSMLNGLGQFAPYILVSIALIITALFTYWLWKAEKPAYVTGYALVIGGAMGNVIDRVRFHAVIDFLDFHAYEYHWPAFNVLIWLWLRELPC